MKRKARSYKTLALEAKDITEFKFVWFSDGLDWGATWNNLLETSDALDAIYNIKRLYEKILI